MECDAELASLFRRALEDPDRNVRFDAIGMLSLRTFAPGGAILEDAARGLVDPEMRRLSIAGVAENEGERAVSFLVDALAKESDSSMRLAVVEALGRAGPGALEALDQVAANDAAAEVRERAKGVARRLRVPKPPAPSPPPARPGDKSD
jgi:hypothetical protein